MGARVLVVVIAPETLAQGLSFGAAAAVDAREGDTAATIREITGSGAHVSVEALGIPQTTNASIQCLQPLGRHVQIGMPSWRSPSLLALIEAGRVDVTRLSPARLRSQE